MTGTIILLGAYGSGKTEIAMTLAENEAANTKTVLIDMDFVTPYYRVQDCRERLETANVTIIAPEKRVAAIDSPSIPPQAIGYMINPPGVTIVDLGGDPNGAVVIAQYSQQLSTAQVWAVVNFSRPTTPYAEIAQIVITEIASAARLKITGIIHNTHMKQFTTMEDIAEGYAEAEKLAAMMQLPIIYTCIPKGFTPIENCPTPTLSITPNLKNSWEK
ncbi:MAG: hypothetical protein WCO98_01080 [bacterium]